MRFCGLLPASILRACFERAIETADGMLLGFSHRALRSVLPGHPFVSVLETRKIVLNVRDYLYLYGDI